MSDFDAGDELDTDMDERLRGFAQSSRTPALPDDTADLPWRVQLDAARPAGFSILGWRGFRQLGIRSAALSAARLVLIVAVAGSFLLVLGQTRPGGSGSLDLIQPLPTPSSSGQPTAATAPEVVLVPTSGVVDAVMADHVSGAVNRAEMDGAAAVIIQLDTLGGALDAMSRITQSLDAKVPTIVWVGPSGASAASAGTFITMSANLAYMAQSTSIGAASPVAANGGDIATQYGQTEADKTMQYAIATMSSLVERTHPQAVAWAVTTVQSARAYTASQALDAHAINGIAASVDDVINQADGQTVTTASGAVTLHLKGANIVTIGEDPIQSFLHALDDPNIAFVLLVLGVLCVAIELFHPTLLMGLLGAFALALSFYGSGSLPLNILGVVLVVIGLIMIMLETSVPSHGLLTAGGILSFIVGAVAFYGSPGPYLPAASVAWPIIGIMAALAATYGLVIVRTLVQMRREPLPVGLGLVGTVNVVGMTGKVERELTPIGTVYVDRESWSARLEGGGVAAKGVSVRVVRKEGLTLIVEKIDGSDSTA